MRRHAAIWAVMLGAVAVGACDLPAQKESAFDRSPADRGHQSPSDKTVKIYHEWLLGILQR